jgi:hypothetical protein
MRCRVHSALQPAPARRRTRRRSGVARLRRLAFALAFSAAGLSDLEAQMLDPTVIVAGDSLRVQLPGALWIDVHFDSWNEDVMMLGTEGVTGDWPVSIFDVSGLQLYAVRTPQQGLRHWAMLGAVGGMFAGAAISILLDTSGAGSDMSGPSSAIVGNTIRWAGLGAVAGAVVGGVYGGRRPGTGWVAVAVPNN